MVVERQVGHEKEGRLDRERQQTEGGGQNWMDGWERGMGDATLFKTRETW